MKPAKHPLFYQPDSRIIELTENLKSNPKNAFQLRGLVGSAAAMVAAAVFEKLPLIHVIVVGDKESAAYFSNDLESLLGESEKKFHEKRVLFYPTSYKRPYEIEKTDNSNILMRTETLKRLSSRQNNTIVVTYPEALTEKVITHRYLEKATLHLKSGETVDLDFIYDMLEESGFRRVDFVAEPGEMAFRGGIIDVFSYTNDYPYRIEFENDLVSSIRSFNPETQLSIDVLDHITIVPNVQDRVLREQREGFLQFVPKNSIIWLQDAPYALDLIEKEFIKAEETFANLGSTISRLEPKELFLNREEFQRHLSDLTLIEFGKHPMFQSKELFAFDCLPQPSFNKNFDLLISNFQENTAAGFTNILTTDSEKQTERIKLILSDLCKNRNIEGLDYQIAGISIHEGFIDKTLKIACYTDHQIFERYHKFRLRESYSGKQAITFKELYDLKQGDYVTHIDHGVGRFDGLEKIENNGKIQEALRIIYANEDLLYVSIHSLHRISKYSGKEGHIPSVDKLGSMNWSKLKAKTKARVKDIAKDLIKLYAQRKASQGFAFTPDTYLQAELEASFIYEDTPDQIKTTVDVKTDMEAINPMDRLVCGDVGFGKTEIAIRAAFKAVADSKQVAILVPTTILALQHYKTFSERLKDFPCRVDYINRFKTTAQQTQTLKELAEGKIDILIGTHRLLSKDVGFKDLGLMIIDEEQRFGVSAKEKLKQLKVNVDTLTLTATPIPRTLQFSLMGARDLSVINTPPPNRYPIQTELIAFNEEVIRDAVNYELSRNGQVFFINNRIQNIMDVAGMLKRIVPDAKIAIGHGQMEGAKLEKIMLDFVDGEYDILVATTIIESGLDIPNANTIVINDAHHYGLSELHQLRGRVGRTNRKAFCYLVSPPLSVLTEEARKRLRAIEEFSEIGSGFNIAMRDLDIRGAGNILGGEQSGFISEIGYEMYQKILEEAMQELRETEFKDVYPVSEQTVFVRDCQVETDLEVMIPDEYVSNTRERLSLYEELDKLESEEKLSIFQENLIDRFGPVPGATQELFNVVRLRWIAKKLGIEKVILRNKNMVVYFVSNPESPFYQTETFTQILKYVQVNPASCRMKESANKLTLTFPQTLSVRGGVDQLQLIG